MRKRPNPHTNRTKRVAVSLLDSDGILTVQEVAQILKVPMSWVYERTRMNGTERLPHFKLGKYLRFRADALRDWLLAHAEA